jgi:SAM-dependent methyltransferase
MKPETTSAEFFEGMYRTAADPWNFATSEYEQRRYAATIAALGERRYRRAFEPGCSVGELTAQLSGRCERVDAMDISATAVERARERCQGLENVDILCGDIPRLTPSGMFDLIVLSEIGYYFEELELRMIVESLLRQLERGGVLLAVHWLGSSKDHVLSGDRVHEVLESLDGLVVTCSDRHAGFRLERWERT